MTTPFSTLSSSYNKTLFPLQRVAKEYTKEELEEVAYLRAKIETYRTHRKTMETKHKDLLERLADMEKNWDEDGENLLFFFSRDCGVQSGPNMCDDLKIMFDHI